MTTTKRTKSDPVELIGKLKNARDKWRDQIKEHKFRARIWKKPGKDKRGKNKIIYVVKRDAWWDKIEAEMKLFQEQLKQLKPAKRKQLQRKLPLPLILHNATEVTLIAYHTVSESNKVLNKEEALGFAKKANFNGDVKGRKFKIRSISGRGYRLSVVGGDNNPTNITFNSYVVCVCDDGIEHTVVKPKEKTIEVQESIEDRLSGAICIHEKRGLYRA